MCFVSFGLLKFDANILSTIANLNTHTSLDYLNEPPRILIVDDEIGVRSALSRHFKLQKFNVELAEDGVSALELAHNFEPHIVISDWNMPGLSGPEFCKNFKLIDNNRNAYFILLTGRSSSNDLVEGLDTGADAYLFKPINFEELFAHVRAGLRIVNLQTQQENQNRLLEEAKNRILEEVQSASSIQKALLPKSSSTLRYLKYSAWYQPATECAGDYYDVIEISESKIGVLIADVSGHGVGAMTAMTLLRTFFHMFCKELDPSKMLEKLNCLLSEYLPTSQFVTAFYCIYDPFAEQLNYSYAGHPSPVFISGVTNDAYYLEHNGSFPLMIEEDNPDYYSKTLKFKRNDKLLLYTDGVVEANTGNGQFYGEDRLLSVIKSSKDFKICNILKGVRTDLNRFMGDCKFKDDASLLAFQANSGK